jgi:hypothetical protein
MPKRPPRRRNKADSQGADPSVYRAIQGKIGQELRERYEASKDLPHRLLALLIQLDAGRKRRVRDR